MAGRRIDPIRITAQQLLGFPSIERPDVDPGVLQARAPNIVEKMTAVRQEGRMAVRILQTRGVESCHRDRLASRGRNTKKWTYSSGREEKYPFLVPIGASRYIYHIAHRFRRPV